MLYRNHNPQINCWKGFFCLFFIKYCLAVCPATTSVNFGFYKVKMFRRRRFLLLFLFVNVHSLPHLLNLVRTVEEEVAIESKSLLERTCLAQLILLPNFLVYCTVKKDVQIE